MDDFSKRAQSLSPEKQKLLEMYLENKAIAKLGTGFASIPPVEEREFYPVSAAQRRMYIINQFKNAGISYNNPVAVAIEGRLERQKLEDIFQKLVQRHEAFRTSFVLVDGEPVQKVHPKAEFKVDVIESGEEEVGRIIAKFVRPFDLKKAPLLRVMLISLREDNARARHILVSDMHHIISDGLSANILFKEFAQLYQGKNLPDLKVQYKDFAVWQNNLLKTEAVKKQEEYWLRRFAGEIPVLNLPLDFPRPSLQNFEGERLSFEAGPELNGRLHKLAQEKKATLYMILLAAFSMLLGKYTGQEDIVVGSPQAGRTHTDLENIVGMFVNTMAMRNFPKGGKRFDEFLGEVRDNSLQAFENQNYQFEELVGKLDIKRDLSRNPLFDTVFAMQNTEPLMMETKDLKFTPHEFENKTAKFDLTLNAVEHETGISFSLEYSRLFKKETAERIVGHFMNILLRVLENPDAQLSEIDMLSEEERRRIFHDFNDTKAECPWEKPIQRFFEEQVEKTPEAIALVFAEKKLTYRELNERSNRLARVLREKGAVPDQCIGLMVERSIGMVVGMLGILKAGSAYLPVPPGYPEERIRYMLGDSGVNILITQNITDGGDGVMPSMQIPALQIINLDDEDLYLGDSSNPKEINMPGNLVYVIYTSGSTGKPKGVMVEHRSALNILMTLQKRFPMLSTDAYLLKTSYTFDVSVTELCGFFLGGGRLVIASKGLEKDPKMIIAAIKENQITHINFVPSMLNYFLESLAHEAIDTVSSLKYVFVAGEAIGVETVREFHRLMRSRAEGVVFENLYGPTEATIYATGYPLAELKNEIPGMRNVPIGKPLPNQKVYILDSYHKLLPVGVIGELHIAGEGLARGYLNRPELTAEKFIGNPFVPGTKMYKSGDLARWLPDGNIEFIGRMDNQVKIRGFRIELGEIETILLKHELIKEAVVIVRENASQNFICAYVVLQGPITTPELKKYLALSLPQYMIPSYFIRIEQMPFTLNGKVDHKALPEPEEMRGTSTREYLPPSNPMEAKLVEIWTRVLHIEKISIQDDFFMIGGNSLSALKVQMALEKEGYHFDDFQALFKYTTIREMAGFLTNNPEYQETAVSNTENKTTFRRTPLLDQKQLNYMNEKAIVLSIDFYHDGYNTKHISCEELAIAGAAGYYQLHNYFFYVFYNTIFLNWGEEDTDILKHRNKILNKLGLELQPIPIFSRSELIPALKQLLGDGYPIVMFVKYGSLPYYPPEKKKFLGDGTHGIIISEYFGEYEEFIARDYIQIRDATLSETIEPLVRADLLARLPLSSMALEKIWESSNQQFQLEDSVYTGRIYTVNKTSIPLINNYRDLMKDFLEKVDVNQSRLSWAVKNWNTVRENISPDLVFGRLKRNFYWPLIILFETIEKAFAGIFNIDPVTAERYQSFQNHFLQSRDELCLKLGAAMINERLLIEAEIYEMLVHNNQNDRALYQLIKELYDINRE